VELASSLNAPRRGGKATGQVNDEDPIHIVKRLIRLLATAGIFCVAIITIWFAGKPASKDYISYWSAGHLLAHHADPYSYSKVLTVEKAQGYVQAKPLIMLNPPWSLILALPLGWGTPRAGLIFWMAAGLACILAYLHLLNVAPENRLFAYLFAPAFASLSVGQSSPFLLLGFALFLRFNRTRPFLAGAALLLMAIKPHLFFVFWPVLLMDCLHCRRFRLLAGSAVALVGATALAMYLDPRIWSEYLSMLYASRVDTKFLPTTAFLLRYLIAPSAAWVQLVPSAAAIAWAIWFYVCKRRIWDWGIHGMPLMLVTIVVSPYAWMTDEIVLLPSIMFALAKPTQARHSIAIFIAINGTAVMMTIAQVQLPSGAYIWTSAAWCGWYLYSLYSKSSKGLQIPILEPSALRG
jgi:hypothetical protein